ncbi:MAG: radical SAM protein [bacterium]|nr:radical SAM protein [bacterium]
MWSSPIRYEEPVFRPPSEAHSLILQLTVGCSWNRCTYCGMYRNKEFRVRSTSEVLSEIEACSEFAGDVRRVFLADGDALAAPLQVLKETLSGIRRYLPSVQRVGLYGDSRSILRHGVDGLSALKARGLGIVYFGPESGDPETLRSVRKGATVERQLEASKQVTASGLKLSMMVLLGLAGTDGSERHARATGRFLAESAPNYAAALMLTPVSGTEFHSACAQDRLQMPDRWGLLQELAWMLEEMSEFRGPFFANHASNYLPLKLRLPRDREKALHMLEEVIARRDEKDLTPEWARGL